jgi:hypothetical protein
MNDRIRGAKRRRLLEEARHRCFMHRREWLRLPGSREGALKSEPLDVHHVIFRACGGSDDIDNLVPLCPSCHATIHRRRDTVTSGRELVEGWQLWKSLGEVVPTELLLGTGSPAATVTVKLDLYGLEPRIVVDDDVSYSEARRQILERTVGAIARLDPYFPFGRLARTPHEWSMSSDLHAPDGGWHEIAASIPFASSAMPLRLEAPVVFALSRDAPAVLSGRDEHRKM